jgi:tryptophan 2,3-dioxygenase
MSEDLTPEILDLIKQLAVKYSRSGQDLASYLEGLLHSDYRPYWDYIHLDTLLSLQNPITPFPDEEIFIMYHQITELYFKMALNECEQICDKKAIDPDFMSTRIHRINRYFEALTNSFDIMIEGMEREQFLKFRMALLPASGFQSGQYRMIELYCTPLANLVGKNTPQEVVERNKVDELYAHIYWKSGATELKSGEKTLTLKQFERKYDDELLELAHNRLGSNILKKYHGLLSSDKNNERLIDEMRNLDLNVNVNWPLAHYKSAVRYLHKDSRDIAATGGTNWQKYLPPRFQKRIFFPDLWTEDELANWGRSWVYKHVVMKD